MNNFENNVREKTIKLLHFINDKRKLKYFSSFNHNEIIIISVIIGVVIFLLLGYSFGEEQSYEYSYVNGYESERGRLTRGERRNLHFSTNTVNHFYFNYILAISGFILSSGISYLFLNSKRK